MAEGASTEESNENGVEAVQNSSPTEGYATPLPPEFKLSINNNEEGLLKGIQTVPPKALLQIQLNNGEKSEMATNLESNGMIESPESNQKVEVSNSDEGTGTRRHSKSSSLPHGVKLCPEGSGGVPIEPESETTGSEEKWVKLEEELRKAQKDLQAKDDEVEKLKGIKQLVEDELEDLTSSLFVEAHKMVSEAKMKEISSEKSLRETKMQMEGLQAEVAALKALLITSTPSKPNLGGKSGISTIFKKQHKRTPSHNHLLYGRVDETDAKSADGDKGESLDRDRCEIDPVLHFLFSTWRDSPTLNKARSEFLAKVYEEDVEPCIQFKNQDLVGRLMTAIEENSIWVDPIPEKSASNVPRECALFQVPRVCQYRMRFAFDSDESYDISQICRDRVASVCEFLNYLRYIKNGLVKASVDDSYWEIIRLRKQMALAKLGLPISS